MEIRRHTLPNGLRLVHTYDPYTAMAAVDVLYNVGSRDERRSSTGMAHLFEHLMFGGSAHVESYDGVLEQAGGRSNAWTSCDFTNFYDVLPASNLDTALYLESDRMLGLAWSERSLEVQRGVVIEEFKQQCLDRPYGDLMHHLRRLVYAADHSYSWPTIGLEPDHIAGVTMPQVKDWFYSHYAPDNAVLAITGNVDFDTACRRAEYWFADVPRREIARRAATAPGYPVEDVVETVHGRVPYPLIVIAFPMPAYGEAGYFAADTITDILAVGRSARLRNNVVNGRGHGLVSDADASIIGSEGPGLLLLTARVTSDRDADIMYARELVLEEARRLCDPGNVTAHELERTINCFETTHRLQNIGYLALATNLATAEIHGEDLNRVVTDRRALTVADISSAAQNIFSSASATVVYKGE